MCDSAAILPHLRDTVSNFAPIPTAHHGGHRTFVPADLLGIDYVFIHRDAHHTPLQRPYEGPFHILERNPKFFIIDFGGNLDTVSVDRLKPAYVDISHSVQVAKPRCRGHPPTKQAIPDNGGSRGNPVATCITFLEPSSLSGSEPNCG